ncbi:3-isopropylmalate dehydrogenase [Tindallia californiensis]|uniref:3-isopropylmalate dehydrogenase n=1 Tax=Tindallia californiensis TaxID=159292 RepID=A0A1H3JST5_9FIRM|nr:3-isopropylmalate dehydrogenase [Tindallia californiensis]SDY43040.1 3-isopropylmalate dehydrogenase [Tindallia californiensis]
MKKKIAVIPGDGIGPEVMKQTLRILCFIEEKFHHEFEMEECFAGGVAIDKEGTPLPDHTLKTCENADAILLGAVGGPKWDHLEGTDRPERALLTIRKELGFFANLRPAMLFPAMKDACPLKPSLIEKGLDLMVVRELTGGIYFGEQKTFTDKAGKKSAYDTMFYHEDEIRRIVRIAFEIASKRKRKLLSVDKANVLESSRLWRKTIIQEAKNYPDICLEHMYIDNAAMQLIRDPNQFDVIVTGNMFGDILSDEASMITGSIGLLPSASLDADQKGMYEPIHGSAPDIAGQNKANPLAMILSAAMMFKNSFDLTREADMIESAVEKVLDEGYRTADIYSENTVMLTTEEMGQQVLDTMKKM